MKQGGCCSILPSCFACLVVIAAGCCPKMAYTHALTQFEIKVLSGWESYVIGVSVLLSMLTDLLLIASAALDFSRAKTAMQHHAK